MEIEKEMKCDLVGSELEMKCDLVGSELEISIFISVYHFDTLDHLKEQIGNADSSSGVTPCANHCWQLS